MTASYYDLLGVEPVASKEEIRAAYRAEVERLRAEQDKPKATDTAKAESRAQLARLNAAWNVLSDPAQRLRYDENLHDGTVSADVLDAPAGARRDGAGRPAAAAPIELPGGLVAAATRPRLLAMAFDLAVLLVLAVGVNLVGARVIDAVYPDQIDELERISDEIDEIDERVDRADEDIQRAEDDGDDAAREAAESEKEAAEEERDDRDAEARDVSSELLTGQLMVYLTTLVIALAYLVPLSVASGATLGKRLRRIRVVADNGDRLGWRGALLRYGVPVLAALALSLLLGQLALLLVLGGMLTWVRNPARQGLHDRLAHTLIVEDRPADDVIDVTES